MTGQLYHLVCQKCGYDRWSEDGFQECPVCQGKDLLLNEEEIKQHCHRVSTSPEEFAFTEKDGTLNPQPIINVKSLLQAQLAKLKRLGWLSPEEVEETHANIVREIFREIESLLSLEDNELGFTEISNHVPYSSWQALKKRYGV